MELICIWVFFFPSGLMPVMFCRTRHGQCHLGVLADTPSSTPLPWKPLSPWNNRVQTQGAIRHSQITRRETEGKEKRAAKFVSPEDEK